MFRMYGKENGKGHVKYLWTVDRIDYNRLMQAKVLHTNKATYFNLSFVEVV